MYYAAFAIIRRLGYSQPPLGVGQERKLALLHEVPAVLRGSIIWLPHQSWSGLEILQ